MRRIIPLLLLCLLTATCSENPDGSYDEDYNSLPAPRDSAGTDAKDGSSHSGNGDTGTFVDGASGAAYSGTFSAVWKVGNSQIGQTTITVGQTLHVSDMPIDYFLGLLHWDHDGSVSTLDGKAWWNTSMLQTGYSATACYFEMRGYSYTQQLLTDGGRMVLTVYFNEENKIALYDKSTDAWSALLPIDSIGLASAQQSDMQPLVERFSPAHVLTLISTKRLKH